MTNNYDPTATDEWQDSARSRFRDPVPCRCEQCAQYGGCSRLAQGYGERSGLCLGCQRNYHGVELVRR